MKTCIHIIFIIFFMALSWTDEVRAVSKPKPQSKTSCTIFRGKFTVSDLVEYHYGIVAGQNVATIKSKQVSSQDVITGLMGGLALQVVWPKGFVIQPEILYSQKGCIFSGSGLKYDIDYLEIPVKLVYRLHMADVKPFVFAAPYGAYAIRVAQNGKVLSDDVFTNEINKFDFGIGAGAGFDVWKIQLSFKYSWGFAQVANESFSIRNQVFTISAGFLF